MSLFLLKARNEMADKNVILQTRFRRRLARATGAIILSLTMTITAGAAVPLGDFYTVTATANYRPVSQPGTQRRVAQTDAEEKARKQIYEYVGSLRYPDGRTVNDILARDARLKARVLEIIRKSETIEWAVAPGCACVQVWVQLDINLVRAALSECGY